MKINLIKTIGVALLGLAAAGSYAAPVLVPHGFIKGNAYEQMSPAEKQRYAAGVFDGMVLAPMFANVGVPETLRLQQCALAMNLDDAQLMAIVDKYMANVPEQWGLDMGWLVYRALIDACNKTGHPLH